MDYGWMVHTQRKEEKKRKSHALAMRGQTWLIILIDRLAVSISHDSTTKLNFLEEKSFQTNWDHQYLFYGLAELLNVDSNARTTFSWNEENVTLQVAYESLQICDTLTRSTSHALEWIELNQLDSLFNCNAVGRAVARLLLLIAISTRSESRASPLWCCYWRLPKDICLL